MARKLAPVNLNINVNKLFCLDVVVHNIAKLFDR